MLDNALFRMIMLSCIIVVGGIGAFVGDLFGHLAAGAGVGGFLGIFCTPFVLRKFERTFVRTAKPKHLIDPRSRKRKGRH